MEYGAIVVGAFTTMVAGFTAWLKIDQGKRADRTEAELDKKQNKEMCSVLTTSLGNQMKNINGKIDSLDQKQSARDEKLFQSINKINIKLAKMNGD